MPRVVITAHALLAPSLARAGGPGWLEDLDLELALGEASPVRLSMRHEGSVKSQGKLTAVLRDLVKADPHWIFASPASHPAISESR